MIRPVGVFCVKHAQGRYLGKKLHRSLYLELTFGPENDIFRGKSPGLSAENSGHSKEIRAQLVRRYTVPACRMSIMRLFPSQKWKHWHTNNISLICICSVLLVTCWTAFESFACFPPYSPSLQFFISFASPVMSASFFWCIFHPSTWRCAVACWPYVNNFLCRDLCFFYRRGSLGPTHYEIGLRAFRVRPCSIPHWSAGIINSFQKAFSSLRRHATLGHYKRHLCLFFHCS